MHTQPIVLHDQAQQTASAPNTAECCKGAAAADCCKTSGAKSHSCCGGGTDEATARYLNAPATRDEMMAFPNHHLVMRFRKGIEHVDRRIFALTERQIDQAFLPDANVGRWPIRVLLGHLADAELVFVHRMRRAVGEDNPVVAMWDEDAFVDADIYDAAPKDYAEDEETDHARVMRALGGSLATIHTLRQWGSQWLMSLAEGTWQRSIMHPKIGPMSVKTILAYDTWHLEHHCTFLTRKLDRMGITLPTEEAEGCGSGCGCKH